MRKLKMQNDMPDSPAGFPVAVCELRTSAEGEVIAWFKTERDAKLFAEVEKRIAEFEVTLRNEEQRRRSEVSTAYRRALILR
ncbi:MAG: hypothetical protein WCK89_11295 [bacterium]